MRYRHDPDDHRLPINLDATTQGDMNPRAWSERP
jgi:hypothetical protein